MTNNILNLKAGVMRRVRVVYYVRGVLNPFNAKVVLFGASAVATLAFISLADVFQNLGSVTEFRGVFSFVYSALLHTEIRVQILLSAAFILFALVLRDIVRNLRASFGFGEMAKEELIQ